MSDDSLEYNFGIIGYGDTADISLLACEDEVSYLRLTFSSPYNRRLKPLVFRLTDLTFSEFYKLVMEAETQVNNLLKSNRIFAFALPQVMDIKFRISLGSVDYMSCKLSVSLAITNDETAFLQLHARDSKRNSSGFSVICDESEFTTLKYIAEEAQETISEPKAENQPPQNIVCEVRNQKFVTVSEQGEISVDVRNPAEARMALKEISTIKKEIIASRRNIVERISQASANHIHQLQQAESEVKGGWFSNILKSLQAAQKDSLEQNPVDELSLLENQKSSCEAIISNLNRHMPELMKLLN